jgi:hypothetical protein
LQPEFKGIQANTRNTTMAQFHEGQEVEVWGDIAGLCCSGGFDQWRKAKIVQVIPDGTEHWDAREGYEVQFHDGTRALFDEDHIRALAIAE